MKHSKVSIIILNWNGLGDTTECLESLKKVTYPNYEVIVVDNGSEGNDVQVLREKFADYIHLIQNDENLGCAKGFNVGIIYALENSRPDYIMIMNNDMVVAPDFLDELVRVAEDDEQIGIVGPKIYYYDYNGRKDVIWSAGGRIRLWSVKISHSIGENDDDSPKYQNLTTVDWITGAALLLKSAVAKKAGLLDPWYFFGYVDQDYSLRVRRHGFRIVYVPAAKVWHKVGASVKKVHLTYADPASYYHFIKQNFPFYIYLYHLLLLPVLMSRWALLFLVKYRDRNMLRRFFTDFAAFILQKPKQRL